jgi:divinyl protochlorophyllide a 8-vinyl-reductase
LSDVPLAGPRAAGTRLIGPNALIQTAAALYELEGESAAAGVLHAAGEPLVREHPPEDMVDERRFGALVTTLVHELGEARAERVLARSGSLTADYLIANRIPQPFQWLVHRLPRDLGLRLLLGAIASHAWTFAGSGRFRYELHGHGSVELEIEDCPACRGLVTEQPVCGFYAGTFERLFRRLVDDRLRVREAGCQACGGARCALWATPDEERA